MGCEPIVLLSDQKGRIQRTKRRQLSRTILCSLHKTNWWELTSANLFIQQSQVILVSISHSAIEVDKSHQFPPSQSPPTYHIVRWCIKLKHILDQTRFF